MITHIDKREEKLVAAGVPKALLAAIDKPSEFRNLEFVAKKPDGFYFCPESIWQDYEILSGFEVTPIYEGCNSDIYYVLLSKKHENRFVCFGLEQDEIYDDYGSNFSLMFASFLIDYYQFSDEVTLEELIDYGLRMGFTQSEKLFKELENADNNQFLTTFEEDKKWRNQILYEIIL